MYEYEYGYDAMPVPEDYMLQEDEWEREGLLDPAWEKQQKKVRQIHGIVAQSGREIYNKRFITKQDVVL